MDAGQFFAIAFAWLVAALWLSRRIVGSRFGLALRAARQNRQRTAAVGIRTGRILLTAFVISGAITGLAGALFADLNRFVSPAMLSWQTSGELLVIVILGGVGRLTGPLAGAMLLVALEHLLGGVSDYWQFWLGALLLLVVLFARGGIVGALTCGMAEAVLQISGVSRAFGALKAVDRVTLDLRPGEIHALIGPNGAGKSTLIGLVTGEVAADAGAVAFLGRDLAGVGVAGRARMGLARTFQVSSVAPEFTVLQNVALAVMGASGRVFRFLRPALCDRDLVETAMGCIEASGLAGRGGARAGTLSHGERRRLEIAMALALGPRAFLLDEPMAGMGADGARALDQLLGKLKQTAPILLVEHDMDAVFRLSDRITVMAGGRVIATGDAAAIRAHPEVRRVYLGDAA